MNDEELTSFELERRRKNADAARKIAMVIILVACLASIGFFFWLLWFLVTSLIG